MLKERSKRHRRRTEHAGQDALLFNKFTRNRMQDRREAGPCTRDHVPWMLRLKRTISDLKMTKRAMARRLRAITHPLWVRGYDCADHRPQVLPLA